ncbi:MAG: serine/threonine protein kinase [Phycisphaerae bacterium]|nr:serine/threonine protein kinase [Phycisphaerae bacterium]
MTSAFHQQAKELFLAVCDMEENARRTYLDSHCGHDPDLRAEVESLLQFHSTKTLIATPSTQEARRIIQAAASPPTPTAASPTVVLDRWPPGTRVADRYCILGVLGRGGMGEVYRAEDLKLSRTVALKFLTAGRGSDTTWLARFHAEARMASTITHRHVCRIHDVGEADGEAFISMEYIDGENLATLVKRVGRLAPEKAGLVARQLCLGLAAAHDRGILHRDLKPANVMLDERGEVRLTDFGIAVSVYDSAVAERAGTLAYMAPELRRGEPATIQSDIYSLGLILYELATGRPAIDPNQSALPDSSRVISPPSAWAGDLDRKLERVMMDCLENDPRHRPESVYDVLAALPGGEVLTAMIASGETPPVDVVADSPARSSRTPVLAIVSAVVALTGLAAALLLANQTLLVSLARLSVPPEVLGNKAEGILQTLGYESARRLSEQAFVLDHDRWDAIRSASQQAVGSDAGLPPGMEVICFRYALFGQPAAESEDISVLDSKPLDGIQAEVLLTGDGHLRRFEGWNPRSRTAAARQDDPPWATLFRLAGLEMSDFKLITTSERPCVWDSAKAGAASIRVRGDELDGRIRFDVGGSLSPEATHVIRPLKTSGQTAMGLIFVATLIAAMPLAWNNARLRTSDRRGAVQIATVVFGMQFIFYLLGHSAPGSFIAAVAWFMSASKSALFTAFMVWIYPNVA